MKVHQIIHLCTEEINEHEHNHYYKLDNDIHNIKVLQVYPYDDDEINGKYGFDFMGSDEEYVAVLEAYEKSEHGQKFPLYFEE